MLFLQDPTPVLSTCFDGAKGHPAARNYEPHTIYVLGADFGGNEPGIEANVSLEAGKHMARRIVTVEESNQMRPMPCLEVNTERDREFVGKPISVRVVRRSLTGQMYVDHVTLKAIRVASTDDVAPGSKQK